MSQLQSPDHAEPASFTLNPGEAFILDVLGQVPVMFHRAYVGVAGSINAALWLSYAMARQAQVIAQRREAGLIPEGTVWFSFSRDDCEDGTGLTRHQQAAARKELRLNGIVLEQRRTTTEVAIDGQRLSALLLAQSQATWALEGETRLLTGQVTNMATNRVIGTTSTVQASS